ncbi:MAG: hypothetical protein P8K77_00205 [Polaribacter sp.]|nr:hypothetical protein [Polaribacter sp.]
MKTNTKKLVDYLKFGLLLFGASILLWNCEKQNFEPEIETTKSPFAQKFVSLSEIPKVKQLLPKKLKSIYQRKTAELNDAIFDEGTILEVIDTLNNANYSFSFLLPTAPKGQLFNLIIGKNAYGELNTPFVLKYTCEEAYVDDFIANNYDFGHFKGTISLHKYTDYFEKDYFSKTTNHDCTEFDQFGDPIPCDISPIDGTGGGGSGTNGGGSGIGTGSGSPIGDSGCTSTYSWWCAAGGTGPHSVESCGAGTGGILIIDISCAFQNKNTTDCPPCTTSIDGGIGINTISILTMRATLKKVLNLRGAELGWVAHDNNVTEARSIYAFLQRNEIDGVYFSEAVRFAKAAVDILSDPIITSNISGYTTKILKMTTHLKQWGNPEDEFFADYIESIIPDFNGMTVGDVYDIYHLTRTQVHNLTIKYLEAVVIPFAEAAYPFIVYAITDATLGVALPLLSRIPLSMVLRGARLNKMVRNVAKLGVQGNQAHVRIITTTNPVQKAETLFATLTKNKIGNVIEVAPNVFQANMGNGNYIIYRTVSSSGFPSTINLNFPSIFGTTPKSIKFIQ